MWWSGLLGGSSCSFFEDVLKVISTDIDKVKKCLPSLNSFISWQEAQDDLQVLPLFLLLNFLVHALLNGLELGAQPSELSWISSSHDLSIKLLYTSPALADVVLEGSPSHTAARLSRQRLSHWHSSRKDLIHGDFLSFLGSVTHRVHLDGHLL